MISVDTADKVSTVFSTEHFVRVQLAQCVLSAANCASSFAIELRPSSNVQCSAENCARARACAETASVSIAQHIHKV